jgi:hypothetical protein
LCKIIQTLNGPKPDLLRLVGGGLQRSLGKNVILTLPDHCSIKVCTCVSLLNSTPLHWLMSSALVLIPNFW